jgi:hypothetical protein
LLATFSRFISWALIPLAPVYKARNMLPPHSRFQSFKVSRFQGFKVHLI